MNNWIRVGVGALAVAVVAGVAAMLMAPKPEYFARQDCDQSECKVEVKVTPSTLPIFPCAVSVTSLVHVTDAVQSIKWQIVSPGFLFRSPNGITILNDASDFRLISSASGQVFKLEFLGSAKHRTYEYRLDIVPVGGVNSCKLPGEGPNPTLPRIKNE